MTSRHAADEDPGRLLRPFAVQVSAGAAGPAVDLMTMVAATRAPDRDDALRPEREQALTVCARPLSIAELAARLDLPVSVVKRLAADMIAEGDLRRGAARHAGDDADQGILRAVLDGLRAL
ncbi:uncharacterized protein DUF742 [Murinocardiopsis flavida]|uniref:Uncharacterized protein DUF742 n=1 Tax=Murinocardiopsis flavida TaxID=645275 RepID=A0A2P8DKA0_9ACTN|nr:DUF742 domain-containing protein [Murinocardiopsis flavida]PSK97618.1 uncharacterized protein DUF742 [Murinocardiopsis flavida]